MGKKQNGNTFIEPGLRADIMRSEMESKNTLQNKGSIYVGTGDKTTIGSTNICDTKELKTSDNVVDIAATADPNYGKVLMVGADGQLGYGFIKDRNLDNDNLLIEGQLDVNGNVNVGGNINAESSTITAQQITASKFIGDLEGVATTLSHCSFTGDDIYRYLSKCIGDSSEGFVPLDVSYGSYILNPGMYRASNAPSGGYVYGFKGFRYRFLQSLLQGPSSPNIEINFEGCSWTDSTQFDKCFKLKDKDATTSYIPKCSEFTIVPIAWNSGVTESSVAFAVLAPGVLFFIEKRGSEDNLQIPITVIGASIYSYVKTWVVFGNCGMFSHTLLLRQSVDFKGADHPSVDIPWSLIGRSSRLTINAVYQRSSSDSQNMRAVCIIPLEHIDGLYGETNTIMVEEICFNAYSETLMLKDKGDNNITLYKGSTNYSSTFMIDIFID